jgi:hypothetical protein|tara:strand:+ start:353 stop:514 length:162 start_codon:yes stop_codon:yes gene_type:complete
MLNNMKTKSPFYKTGVTKNSPLAKRKYDANTGMGMLETHGYATGNSVNARKEQ